MLTSRLTGLTTLSAALAAALPAGPALGAPPAAAELTGWLARNTDLLPSQIALVGPENVYSLEPLGPRSPSGEVIALVRTEAFADGWGAAHGFQSWDANLLIDCSGRRLQVIRSARYPGRNRQGRPVADAPDKDWTTPEAGAPSTRLVAAACDPTFAWPLRTALTATSAGVKAGRSAPVAAATPVAPEGKLPEVVEIPGPKSAPPPPPAAEAKAAPAAQPAPQTADAKPTPTTPTAEAKPAAPAPPAPAVAEAKPAAATPAETKQQVVATAEPKQQIVVPGAEAQAQVVLPQPEARPRISGPPLHALPGVKGPFALQIVQGPSETDAKRILAAAHAAMGSAGGELGESVQRTVISGGRVRYLAYLEGFATQDAANASCQALQAKKQDCAVRAAAAPSPAAAPPPAAASAAPTQPAARDGSGAWFVQVGRGPSEEGARKALDAARKTLGPLGDGLTSAMDAEQLGAKKRYTARLEGFPSEAAAQAACDRLAKARQACFFRPLGRVAAR